MVQWKLTDNSSGSPVVLTFDINPSEFDHPGRRSNILSQLVTAPNGGIVVFQGRDHPRELTFKGAVLTQTFYDSLDLWKDKHYPLTLTDDQGNVWTILFQTWTWQRIKRRNPWRFDYTAKALIL
jgi:hypothetical protein